MWNSLIFYHWYLIPYSSYSVSVSVLPFPFPDSGFRIPCFSTARITWEKQVIFSYFCFHSWETRDLKVGAVYVCQNWDLNKSTSQSQSRPSVQVYLTTCCIANYFTYPTFLCKISIVYCYLACVKLNSGYADKGATGRRSQSIHELTVPTQPMM